MPELTRPHDRDRDAFGRLLVDPGELSQRERIDVLRRLAGSLQADATREARWLGSALSQWLSVGGDLAGLLGVRAPRGSHSTPQRTIEREHRDRMLVRFAAAVGCDRDALRILRGAIERRPELREQADELRRLRVPTAHDAVTRARRRFAADKA